MEASASTNSLKDVCFQIFSRLIWGSQSLPRRWQQARGIPLNAKKRTKLELLDAGDLEELKQCILDYDQEIEQETLLAVEYRRQRGE